MIWQECLSDLSVFMIKENIYPLKCQVKLQQTTFLLFLLLSFEENKAWCFMWILCQAEDSHEISNIIFSEKQWKSIYKCRLLQL